jgi:hypothetical protein
MKFGLFAFQVLGIWTSNEDEEGERQPLAVDTERFPSWQPEVFWSLTQWSSMTVARCQDISGGGNSLQ